MQKPLDKSLSTVYNINRKEIPAGTIAAISHSFSYKNNRNNLEAVRLFFHVLDYFVDKIKNYDNKYQGQIIHNTHLPSASDRGEYGRNSRHSVSYPAGTSIL